MAGSMVKVSTALAEDPSSQQAHDITSLCNSNSRETYVLFRSPGTPAMEVVHRPVCKQNINKHNTK